MKKTSYLAAAIAFASMSHAAGSIVILSTSFSGPIVYDYSGFNPISNGTILVGTLSSSPASSNIEDIAAVFETFGEAQTSSDGRLGNVITNLDAGNFNDEPIFLWIFDGAPFTSAPVNGHALLSLADPDNPSGGDPWKFPVHDGTGTDTATIQLDALTSADFISPGSVQISNNSIMLGAIPEPSSALLAALGVGIIFRRRRH